MVLPVPAKALLSPDKVTVPALRALSRLTAPVLPRFAEIVPL